MDGFLRGVERRAYRMAHIATADPDEALEIVQDAMFKLVQRYADRTQAEWGPLFHRILQSRINDWHRRRSVRRRWLGWLGRQDEEGAADPIQEAADPAARGPRDELESRQAAAGIDEALRQLPPRQQQAFLLRAWEGLDVAATARAMGCSAGSVKTHYSRALAGLRAKLEDHRP